jgi:sugar (pentulose or hexulose) kinase
MIRDEYQAGKGFRDLTNYDGLNQFMPAESKVKYLEQQLAYKDQEIEFLKMIVSLGQEDTGSKGGIIGLTLENNAADLYRAILESVCYEMAMNIERLMDSGIEIHSLHATGGGAKSERREQHEAYRIYHERYRKLYQAIRPLV